MNPRRISLLFAAAVLLTAAGTAGAQIPQPAAQPQAAISSAQPIPKISTLMHQVLENQDQVDKLRENYACRDARIVQKLDKHGRVKKTTTYVYQVSFFDGHQIHRLIQKNGQPLSAKARKKEDNRIRKQIEKYARDNKSGKQAKQRKKAKITIQDFLKADRFYHPRRELLDGRSVIAFDFAANPEFKARSRAEKVAQSLAGTIWIDANAHEVVRLDARFAKSYKVGWGLVASVHRGTAIAFRQTLLHNQVWLPTYVEARISVRALFFHLRQAETDRYSHYRRFHVRSTSHTFPPKQP